MSTVRIEWRFRGPLETRQWRLCRGAGRRGLSAGLIAPSRCSRSPPIDKDLTLQTDDTSATMFKAMMYRRLRASQRADRDRRASLPPTRWPRHRTRSRALPGSPTTLPGLLRCGPERRGRRRHANLPGALHDKDHRVAATWTRTKSVTGDDGPGSAPTFLWAALDCPGLFRRPRTRPDLALLGRMSAVLHRRRQAGEPLIVTGWPIGSEGRKHQVGSALHDANGQIGRRRARNLDHS